MKLQHQKMNVDLTMPRAGDEICHENIAFRNGWSDILGPCEDESKVSNVVDFQENPQQAETLSKG